MMTAGRLRAIRSHATRFGDKIHPGVAHRFLGECVEEIERLREALNRVTRVGTGPNHDLKLDPHGYLTIIRMMTMMANEALAEPDLGKPDFTIQLGRTSQGIAVHTEESKEYADISADQLGIMLSKIIAQAWQWAADCDAARQDPNDKVTDAILKAFQDEAEKNGVDWFACAVCGLPYRSEDGEVSCARCGQV